MLRSAVITALALGIATTAFADTFVQGATTGTFSNETTGTTSGNTWTFESAPNLSSIVFTGANFGLGPTPLVFNLGELTLNNGGNGGGGGGTFTADLDLDVAFTTPGGQNANFLDTITLVLDNGGPNQKVAITDFPLTPQSFTVAGTTYTVTFNGMFDAETDGGDITATGLTVANAGGSSGDEPNVGHAWLRATVTSSVCEECQVTQTPEPGSVSLLLTAVGGIGFAFLRKRRA